MTHWKRALLLAWGIIALLTIGLDRVSQHRALQASCHLGPGYHLLIGEGMLQVREVSRSSVLPAHSVLPTQRLSFRSWEIEPLEVWFNKVNSGSPSRPGTGPLFWFGNSILKTSLSTLLLLHTAFFTLLYLLANRRYRKKTTALPQAPSSPLT